jgi:hypothetical protein
MIERDTTLKVLFKLGDWSIVVDPAFMGLLHQTYARHTKCKKMFPNGDVGWWVEGPPKCRYCAIPVPDEIQATLILLLGNTKPGAGG